MALQPALFRTWSEDRFSRDLAHVILTIHIDRIFLCHSEYRSEKEIEFIQNILNDSALPMQGLVVIFSSPEEAEGSWVSL